MKPQSSFIRCAVVLLVATPFAMACAGVYPLITRFGPPDIMGAGIVYGCFGMIAAAAALLAIAAVFGPGSYWLRMIVSCSCLLALFGCWAVGAKFGAGWEFDPTGQFEARRWQAAWTVLLCLPLLFYATQLPLWLVRLVWNWDIVQSTSQSPARMPHLRIADMLAMMIFVSLTLASTKAASVHSVAHNRVVSEGSFWMAQGFLAVMCTLLSFATTVPLVAATLRCRRLRTTMFFTALYVVLAIGVWISILMELTRLAGDPSPPASMLFAVAVFELVLGSAIVVPLLIGRAFGLRLRWRREAA